MDDRTTTSPNIWALLIGIDCYMGRTIGGLPEDRYVRDLELAVLLQALVDRGLIVTVVLDSCHSGGAARGRGQEKGVRGSTEIDMIPRVPSTLVGSPGELATHWQRQTRGTRAASVASGWLPDPNGYTLLAACRALELAPEYGAPNGKLHGVLSYWLWHTLQSPTTSWEMVHQQVIWSISRFLPPIGDAEDYYDLEPGETLLLPRKALPGQPQELPAVASSLPPGAEEAIDILKVCATTRHDQLQFLAVAGPGRGHARVAGEPSLAGAGTHLDHDAGHGARRQVKWDDGCLC